MLVYKYDDETGEYLHPVQLQKNPKYPDRYLKPAKNTLTDEPFAPGRNQAVVVNTSTKKWELVADYRNTEYYLPDGSFHIIKSLREKPPVDALDAPPPPSAEKLIQMEREWRDHEIGLTDRVFTRDFGPNEWTEADRETAQNTIMEHRRNLKDWSEKTNPNFPNSDHRPVWPESVPRPAV